MSLSTQRQFFRLQYAEDGMFEPEPLQAATKAKSMDTSLDSRAWSMCGREHARYLLDQVHYNDDGDASRGAGGDGGKPRPRGGQLTAADLKAMSKAELVDHVQDLYKRLASKNDEMLRLEALLEETVRKLRNIQNIVEENGQLRTMLRESNEALETLNRERVLIQENISRRSRDTDYGQLRTDYEQRRESGQLSPADEIDFLKRQLAALESDANRVAVADAEAAMCREEVIRLRQRLRLMPQLVTPDGDRSVASNVMLIEGGGEHTFDRGMLLDPRRIVAETSTDVPMLQTKVNNLNVELRTLRNIEEDYHQLRREHERLKAQLQRRLPDGGQQTQQPSRPRGESRREEFADRQQREVGVRSPTNETQRLHREQSRSQQQLRRESNRERVDPTISGRENERSGVDQTRGTSAENRQPMDDEEDECACPEDLVCPADALDANRPGPNQYNDTGMGPTPNNRREQRPKLTPGSSKRDSIVSAQVENVLRERDRLRSQLDKMTSIEDKLLALKDRAQGCADMERERNELRRLCTQQAKDLQRFQIAHSASAEALRNAELERALQAARVADEQRNGRASVQQLKAAEQAIAEYERDIQGNIATINALNEQLAERARAQAAMQERLRALDELESEVNQLQAQLSAALAQQRTTPQMADLVAAVKLTLLYVQNKLTSRETMGNEAELERLKAELLNLRDNRQTEMLTDARAEIERLQKAVNAASMRDTEGLQRANELNQMLRGDIKALRANLEKAAQSLRAVMAKADQNVKALQDKQRRSKLIIEEQQNTIVGLQEHTEATTIRQSNVEEDMLGQLREMQHENANLRDQIRILNGQMDELSALISEIERERNLNRGLQEELNAMEHALNGLPGEGGAETGVRDVKHMDDALRACTDQLEAECAKNQALEQQVAQLKAHVFMLKEKLRRFVSRSSELELAEATSKELADRLAEMNDRNAMLEGEIGNGRKEVDAELRVGNYNKSSCPCGCLMVNESDESFNKQNSIQDENWRKYCEKILQHGIGSLNLHELSELHQLVYLAGLRHTHEIRRRRFPYTGSSLKEKHNFYERKEQEHQRKVRELQHQLNEIRLVMRQLRRDEAMRVKREHVLLNAYRAMNKSDEILHQRGSARSTTGDRSSRLSSLSCKCKATKRIRSKSVI